MSDAIPVHLLEARPIVGGGENPGQSQRINQLYPNGDVIQRFRKDLPREHVLGVLVQLVKLGVDTLGPVAHHGLQVGDLDPRPTHVRQEQIPLLLLLGGDNGYGLNSLLVVD